MSFTGIGRIGSQHTLTLHQDDTLYLFNSAMWCTHPLLGKDFMDSGTLDTTEGSKIVTGTGTLFTTLCNDIQMNNTPLNKYIAYNNGGGGYGILEVDYVLNDTTLILKYPAFETVATTNKVSLIDYWNTPILKEVECRSAVSAGFAPIPLIIVNKYSSNVNQLWDVPYTTANEGGLEPMLLNGDGTILVILKY